MVHTLQRMTVINLRVSHNSNTPFDGRFETTDIALILEINFQANQLQIINYLEHAVFMLIPSPLGPG